MKTVSIEQAVEQTNATQVFAYGGLRAERLAPSQSRPESKILSGSVCTETENYNCVQAEMRAMINDHGISITN